MNPFPCKKKRLCFCLALVLFLPLPALSDEDKPCDSGESSCQEAEDASSGRVAPLAGPEQVENRLHIDSNQVTPMFPSSFARGYFDWKDRIK